MFTPLFGKAKYEEERKCDKKEAMEIGIEKEMKKKKKR